MKIKFIHKGPDGTINFHREDTNLYCQEMLAVGLRVGDKITVTYRDRTSTIFNPGEEDEE